MYYVHEINYELKNIFLIQELKPRKTALALEKTDKKYYNYHAGGDDAR